MNENEEPEVLSVEVATVVERLIAELAKVNRRVDALEVLGAIQQQALEKLGAVVDAHQRLFEAQAGYRPPSPGDALSN